MKLERLEGGLLSFYCPGCRCSHGFDSRWTFNGDMEAPTFSPSLLVAHWIMPNDWDYETAPRDEEGGLILADDGTHVLGAFEVRCHSFVREGVIEYLGDCTHELAGQAVPMKDLEEV